MNIRDIDKDPEARRELLQLGSRSIPTFKIRDEVMIGFDPDRFQRMLRS